MSRLLVILDGASEPTDGPTALERAHTPALDALVRAGALGRVRTTPGGLEPGSETGLPTLLGAAPAEPVGRGWVEAAAARLPVPDGLGAWRVDVFRADGTRAAAEHVRTVSAMLRMQLCRHRVEPLRGHRLLVRGARRPKLDGLDGFVLRVWPDGATLPPTLDERTAVVSGPGAAAGCARLLGARAIVPAGATGDVDSDLGAKARVAAGLLSEGVETVVVHVGGPDEAAHRRDPEAKRAAIEAADREVLAPLWALARGREAAPREPSSGRDERAIAGAAAPVFTVAVAIDHGTSPETGRHDAVPTPCVVAGPGIAASGHARLTEREAETTAVRAGVWLPQRVRT